MLCNTSVVNLNGQVGDREKKDNRGKKQWKKNGKLMLCNKAPPILRRHHRQFLCKWPQGFQSFLSLMITPEAPVTTITRVRCVFLSEQVGVRRFATSFGFYISELVSSNGWKTAKKRKCPTSGFYSINGRIENTGDMMACSFSLSFPKKERRDGENVGKRMLCFGTVGDPWNLTAKIRRRQCPQVT